MSEKKNKKKNPFSIYWIYAVIGVAIIGIQLFMSTGSSVPVKSEETFFNIAREEGIKEAYLVNKERVDYTLNEKGKEFVTANGDPRYTILRKTIEGNQRMTESDAVFSTEIKSPTTFSTRVYEENKSLKEREKSFIIDVESKTEHDYFGGILSFMLPIIILIVIWLFVMRRMTGGAGGGG